MSETVLSDSHAQLLHQEKKVLGRVRDLILKTGDSSSELDTLSQAIQGLDQLFLLVVVGEYNSGKSSFINALVASKLFAEGVTPTTDRINVLRYGTREQVQELADGLIERTYPLEFLKQINLVDTPGTNAIMQRHQALSEGFIPRADFVLFITSADHPFTESERQFLEKIKSWGKKIVFVLNKVDILESDADLGRTVQFIADNARHLLGLEPLIFPVSSKLAFSAKAKGDKGMLRLSGFPKVEDYILHTLDERERVRLKLLGPIGISEKVTKSLGERLQQEQQVLNQDLSTIDNVQEQLETSRKETSSDFERFVTKIHNLLLQMEARGTEFFDANMRLGRVFYLAREQQVRRDFEAQVVAEVPREIERQVHLMVDWLVDRNLRLWTGIMEYLRSRREIHRGRLIGEMGGQYEYNRERLFATMSSEVTAKVESFDRARESRELTQSVLNALLATGVVELGAIGIGAVVLTLFTSLAADVTGLTAAGLIAITGLFILPNRRRQAKRALQQKLAKLRSDLELLIKNAFEREIDHSIETIRTAIEPYVRLCHSEKERLEAFQRELSAVSSDLGALRQAMAQL